MMVTEIAPGANLENDVLAQAGFKLNVADNLKTMQVNLFQPQPFGLSLQSKPQMSEAAE
jgi:acyl CoA:acetate/3-ketoacid CoA transferase